MITAITHFDALLFTLINSHHTPFLDRVLFVITQLGNGWVAVPLAAVIIILRTPRKYLAGVLVCAAAVGLVSGTVNTQVKRAVNRDRPVVYFVNHDTAAPPADRSPVHVVGEVLKKNSFPSGHANTAFSVATLLALFFGGWYWSGFAVAALVGFSRVYVGAHFPLDTVAGGLMGMLLALAIIRFFQWQKFIPRVILVSAHDKQ